MATATELGAAIISGSSVKAALDIDWDNPEERSTEESKLLVALQAAAPWLEQHDQLLVADKIKQNLKVARQVESQDVEVTANGTPQLRQLTKSGRAKLRERVAVEHSLAPERSLAKPSCSLYWFAQKPVRPKTL